MQKNLDQHEDSSRAQNGSKSDIIVLDGEGDRFEKSLRDRATGLDRSNPSGEEEVW